MAFFVQFLMEERENQLTGLSELQLWPYDETLNV